MNFLFFVVVNSTKIPFSSLIPLSSFHFLLKHPFSYLPLSCLGHVFVLVSFMVQRGFRGGSEGVGWGLVGPRPSEHPINPQ